MTGYMNRILKVDLTRGSFREESLPPELIRDYVGGRGFGAKLLYDGLKPGVEPLSPDNLVVLVAGPLAGTSAQSMARWKAFFKSPLTGGYFMSSGGGTFAAELKFAGLDAVVISGRAERPVYLWLRQGRYQLREAGYLWGLDCDDTQTLIREELRDPKVRLAAIGPAGENLVSLAGIFTDRRAAARGGGGAVMGSKNLKAVAVRGRGRVEPADKEGFKAAVREQVRRYRSDPGFEAFSRRGTQNPEFTNLLGIFPTRNFQEGVLPNWERIDSSQWDKLRVRNHGCHNCILHCGSITKVSTGPLAGAWSEGPEYETAWAFSGSMAIDRIDLLVAADKLCDDLGLDTISTGVAIGFAYELFERGLLGPAETGGLTLRFGNPEPVLELVRMIAFRQGLGDLLARGVREAAREIGRGAERYAIQVKGLELPGYDPRGAKAMGLHYLTAPNGADHCSGYASQEIFGVPYQGRLIDRFTTREKGEITRFNQNLRVLQSLGIMCNFAGRFVDPALLGRLLAAATGVEEQADPEHLWLVAERIFNLERMFNAREGFGAKDDVLPERFMKEPLPQGPAQGQVLEAEELLADYYRARGWDPGTGNPTGETLVRLGLEWTI